MTEYISLSGQAAPALENAPMAFWRDFEWTCRKCLGADACLLDPPHGHRPYTRGPRVGAGIPDERDRNRVSVSKSICHSEFPDSRPMNHAGRMHLVQIGAAHEITA